MKHRDLKIIISQHLYSMTDHITDSLADKQTERIFEDIYFHAREGHRHGFRLEMLIN